MGFYNIKIMRKIIIIALLNILVCFVFAQSSLNKEFAVNGTIKNFSGKYIIINYLNSQGKLIKDTANVTNGVFNFKGNISEPTLASLSGAIKSASITDPNFTELFLEPNQLKIEIEESHFKSLRVIGSKTQDELEKLKTIQKPINDKLETLNLTFSKLRNEYIKLYKPDSLALSINKLRQEINSLSNELIPSQIAFVKEYNRFYASAFLIFQNLRNWPLDSCNNYYANLSPEVQSSFYGKLINKSITSNKSSVVGLVAPIFKVNDINNKEVNLLDFKDRKYVLLDFWASWCIPCRKSTPELIKTYNLYKQKGLEIISISIDENEKAWRAAVAQDKIPWLNILTSNKSNDQSLKSLYNVTPVPTYILIDKAGVIVGRYEGADEALNTELLKDLEKIFTSQ
jgi:thiol-disulfide isomerase/thioredoxin